MNPENINNHSFNKIILDDTQKEEISQHSKRYSDLLEIYINSINHNIKIKYRLKISFFIITISILIGIVFYSGFTLNYIMGKLNVFNNLNEISLEAIFGSLTIILPVISSLIVAFIEIPKIIAQYLFNPKEDRYINSTIENIQNYDRSMFQMEYNYQQVLKNISSNRLEEEIELSPVIEENTNDNVV